MPFTDDGAARLAVELERAHELIDPPAMVWLFDPELLRERRAALYAWRSGAPRRALVVWRDPPHDVVTWVCEPYVRPRGE